MVTIGSAGDAEGSLTRASAGPAISSVPTVFAQDRGRELLVNEGRQLIKSRIVKQS